MSETWLEENENNVRNLIPNAKLYLKSSIDGLTKSRGRPYGGIGWAVKKSFNHIYDVIVYNNRMSAIVMKELAVLGVYLTSNSSKTESYIEHQHDFVEMINILESLKAKNIKEILVVGDFNSDQTRKNKFDKALQSVINEHKLILLDAQFKQDFAYTYTNGLHKSWIDHVLSFTENTPNIIDIKILGPCELNTSDHLAIKTSVITKIYEKEVPNLCKTNVIDSSTRKIFIDWKDLIVQTTYRELLKKKL